MKENVGKAIRDAFKRGIGRSQGGSRGDSRERKKSPPGSRYYR